MNLDQHLENFKILEKMSEIKHKIIVISGKGGVGKTSVSVNLAKDLSSKVKKVGILDADIHGPNVAKMLGIEHLSMKNDESGLKPIKVTFNLIAVSLALMGYDTNQPFVWRGPMKANVIKQLLENTNWGTLDYLIVDLPPGTGDEALSICQLIPNITGAIIVTTPQDVAILDCKKSVRFIQELKIPIIGLIENMSGFVCPHCQGETNIFKKGGGRKAAEELNISFLGEVPFQPEFVNLGDSGTPFVSSKEKSKSADVFMAIVNKIGEFVK